MKPHADVAWGKLVSKFFQHCALLLRGSIFSVGQSRCCNLRLRDPSVSQFLYKLRHIENQDSSSPLLEITGNKCVVQVNSKIIEKNSFVYLQKDDEVVFSLFGKHVYVFQQLAKEVLTASVNIKESHSAPVMGAHFTIGYGDSSAIAEASILVSPVNLGTNLSYSQPAKNSEVSESCMPYINGSHKTRKRGSKSDETVVVSSSEKSSVAVSTADVVGDGTLRLDYTSVGAHLNAETVKIFRSKNEMWPFMQILTRSSVDYEVNGSMLKTPEEQKERRGRLASLIARSLHNQSCHVRQVAPHKFAQPKLSPARKKHVLKRSVMGELVVGGAVRKKVRVLVHVLVEWQVYVELQAKSAR